MVIINLNNFIAIFIYTLINASLIAYGWIKRKSIFCLVPLLIYTALLVLHSLNKILYQPVNYIADFTGIMVSLVSYLIVDEIEIRREKISEVFEDRYKEVENK